MGTKYKLHGLKEMYLYIHACYMVTTTNFQFGAIRYLGTNLAKIFIVKSEHIDFITPEIIYCPLQILVPFIDCTFPYR